MIGQHGAPSGTEDSIAPPLSWESVLNGAAYIINLDSRPDRLERSRYELSRAGFTRVSRYPAIDARDRAALTDAWRSHGSPPFAEWDERFKIYPGKQGCFLSHIAVWNAMVQSDIPFAAVFEDDIIFHRHWTALAPSYFLFTPPDYDIVFIGSQIETPGTGLVRRAPAHCTHAYLITRRGARRLSSMLLGHPEGVATIDSMIIQHQWRDYLGHMRAPFDWYVWDGTIIPDPRAAENPGWRRRNTGLVFQDFALGTDLEWQEPQ